MNPVAETLTGFREPDSLGRDLTSVFVTHDPTTGQGLGDPTVAMLKSGHTSRFLRDKTLSSKDGASRPIEDTWRTHPGRAGRLSAAFWFP